MILDATTKKLQVVLGGAITSAQLQVNVSWADTQNGATFVPGSNSAVTNSATPVDIVAAPAASTQRQIKEVTIQNTDTAAATVTVQTVDGANTRKNIVVTIQVGETLFFAAGQWGVLATNGAIKGSAGVSSVALTMPSDFAVAGSPITTTGTLAVTANNQSANTFKAGPVSGGAAPPTYRTVVAADLNSLAFTAGSVLFGNASGGIGQDNSKLFWDDTNLLLGIGNSATIPDSRLTLNDNSGAAVSALPSGLNVHLIGANSANVRIVADTFAANSAYLFRRADGTRAAPASLGAAALITNFAVQGWNSVAAFATTAQLAFQTDSLWSVSDQSSTMTLGLTPVGSLTRSTTTTWYGDGRHSHTGARLDLSYSKQTPLTGFSITPADTVENLILTPAGALLAGTIIMPANPKDGQYFTASCTQVVTTLTMNPNAGQTLLGGLSSFTANGFASWIYVASTTTWYRRG